MDNFILNMEQAIKLFLGHDSFVFKQILDNSEEIKFVIVSDESSIESLNDKIHGLKNQSFIQQLSEMTECILKTKDINKKVLIETESL